MEIVNELRDPRSHGWRTLAALHRLIQTRLEDALRISNDPSGVEFAVPETVANQGVPCVGMQHLGEGAGLSGSVTTRLVMRLEARSQLRRLTCRENRRGIHVELTQEGRTLFMAAQFARRDSLCAAIEEARAIPEPAVLAQALHPIPDY